MKNSPLDALAFDFPVLIHNVTLESLSSHDDGSAMLYVSIDGVRCAQRSAKAADTYLPLVGKTGYLSSVGKSSEGIPRVSLVPYVEPTLRRRPEFDTGSFAGWSCAQFAHIHAPHGLIPGLHGSFIPDTTQGIEVRIPEEFAEACHRYGVNPHEVLSNFVGDAAGIRCTAKYPRADRISGSGSSGSEAAAVYLDRCYSALLGLPEAFGGTADEVVTEDNPRALANIFAGFVGEPALDPLASQPGSANVQGREGFSLPRKTS